MTWALKSFNNFHFNGLLLSKVYIVQAKKVQRSYLSWNWRGLQNLERNWLVVSKLTYAIWQVLTWALKSLKNFHFNRLLLSKLYIVWAKNVQRSYFSWNWRGMQNFKELTCRFNIGIRNLAKLDLSTEKSQRFSL